MAIPNRGPELIAVNIALLTMAIFANALRCFVRIKMVKAFGVDDWLMVASTLFFTAYCVSSITGAQHGTGRHHRDLSEWQIERARMSWFFCYLFYCCSMILSKVSIGFFLLRISVQRIHTWIIYAAMFISACACTAFFFVILFQCHPIRYFWVKSLPNGTCINSKWIIALGFIYSSFSIIADFILALLPAALVWNLQLKRRTKIALIPLLTMGCVASAAVIARLPFLTKLNSPDFLWDTLDVAIWSTVEPGLAIIAGSLATLRPLFTLAMHQLGLTTHPTKPRPSQYGLQTPPASQMLNSRRKGSKNDLDTYGLSNIQETRVSDDSLANDADSPKSPNWFNGNGAQQSMTKSQIRADNESERSLRLKSTRNSSEDQMGIMVSKTFWVDEERASIASRGQDPRFR